MKIFSRKDAPAGIPLSQTREGLPKNRYEAAIPNVPGRPYLPAFVRDARFDANSFTRWEITRKVRYYFRNTWLLPRLCEEDVKYTVGPHGLQVIPASSDPNWNSTMADAYAEWCEMPFRDSSLPMGQGQRLAWSSTHMDGEVFGNFTSVKYAGSKSYPAIELIESHRVSSPGVEYDAPVEDSSIIDGVQLGVDANGRRIGRAAGYYVREGEKWNYIKAYDPAKPGAGGIVHIYEPERIGMARAISHYAPILAQTADLDLLAALEMDKAKTNSELAAIFESWNGELPAGLGGTQAAGSFLLPGQQPSIPGVDIDKATAERINQFRKVISSHIIAVRPGEKMTFTENPSPSAAQQWLWKLVISQICAARNIPVMLVLPESIQGTVARAILDDANLTFQAKFAIAARFARASYRFFADWARYNVPELSDAPADWAKCHITPPRACNVDFGRNSSAMLAELYAGTRSFDDAASADGTTADQRFIRKARNIGRVKQIAAEVSREMNVEIMPAEIAGDLATVISTLAKGGEPDGDEGGEESETATAGGNKKAAQMEEAE